MYAESGHILTNSFKDEEDGTVLVTVKCSCGGKYTYEYEGDLERVMFDVAL